MPQVTYYDPSDKKHEVELPVGMTLMEGAVTNYIEGILADCGGSCSCGTCHVHVDPDWYEKTGDPSEEEDAVLDTVHKLGKTSRLGCQIEVTAELDGIIVRIPGVVR
jgi:ferredoxin, 2Fe-2S